MKLNRNINFNYMIQNFTLIISAIMYGTVGYLSTHCIYSSTLGRLGNHLGLPAVHVGK